MNKTIELPATNAQKRCIHRLRRQFGLDEDEYRHFVRQFSGGRTTTSAELCKSEAARLIGTLLDPDGRKDPEDGRNWHWSRPFTPCRWTSVFSTGATAATIPWRLR